jgi:hypothetical protein
MDKAKRLKMLFRCLLAVSVVSVVMGITMLGPAHTAKASGYCDWFVGNNATWRYTDSFGSRPFHIDWDVNIWEYRDIHTFAYCGYVQTEVCITLESDYPYNSIGVTNEWGNPSIIGATTPWFNTVYNTPLCAEGPYYYVAQGGNAVVVYKYWDVMGSSSDYDLWDTP